MGVDCLNITSQSRCKFRVDKTWTPNTFFNPLLSFPSPFPLLFLSSYSSFERNMTPVLSLVCDAHTVSTWPAERSFTRPCMCTHTGTSSEGEFVSRRNPGEKMPIMMNSQKICNPTLRQAGNIIYQTVTLFSESKCHFPLKIHFLSLGERTLRAPGLKGRR